MIEIVQKNEIYSYQTLAKAVGVTIQNAMSRAIDLEVRGRLTRTQSGAFVALSFPEEPKSGLFLKPLPPLTKEKRTEMARRSLSKMQKERREQKEAAARPTILRAVIEQSELVLRGAPPDNPELGRLIIEAKAQSPAKRRTAKRAAEVAAGRARFEALEQARAEKKEAARRAKEAAKIERAKAAEERRAARDAIERFERQERRIARGMKSGRSKYCRVCEGLGERRPKDAPCPGCGEAYEREVIEISVSGFSSLATFDAH